MKNIDALLDRVHEVVKTHYLGNGGYARYLWQDDSNQRKLGVNEYGCADALNILYMLSRFPVGEERKAARKALASLQNAQTGLFEEATHHVVHTTAHCTAALELFDALPMYPQKQLQAYFTKEGLRDLLENLRWTEAPWVDSHIGAGIYVVGVLTDNVDLDWQNYYFDLLYENTDPVYGMSRQGTIDETVKPLYHHLNGWFHYMFNMQYAKRPLRYPERLIDSCIRMYDERLLGESFGKSIGFAEVDWVYVLNRATRETPYRFAEAKDRLEKFAETYLEYLESLDFVTHDGVNDLHGLFGALCCVAELQTALPGKIISTKPLRPVLERRPFI